MVIGKANAASPLSGYAPIFGVYGLGGIAALCAAGLAWIVIDAQRRWQGLVVTVTIFAAGWVCKR